MFTYVIDDESTHTATCSYCGYSVQQQHTTQDCPCGIHETVRKKFTLYVPGDTKGSYVEAASYEIGAGKEFYLPDCTTIPDGYDGHESDYDITAPVFSGVTINGIMGGAAGLRYPLD